jgi:lysophospholipase L1-like esterase
MPASAIVTRPRSDRSADRPTGAAQPGLEALEPRTLLSGNPLQVLAMGDSITFGVSDPTFSYRAYLADLFDANNVSYDFVGTLANGNGFDNDHFGIPGARAERSYTGSNGQLRVSMTDALRGNQVLKAGERPDVVLLHIGTNSLWPDSATAQDAANELRTLLNELGNYWSSGRLAADVDIYLAKIIPGARDRSGVFSAQRIVTTDAYNDLMAGVVNSLSNAAFRDRITLVDHFATRISDVAFNFTSAQLNALQSDGDAFVDWFNGVDESNPAATAVNTNTNLMAAFGDYLHPTALGYQVMATTWYNAMFGAGSGGGSGGGGTPVGSGSVVQQVYSGRTSFDGLDVTTGASSTRTLNRLETASGIGDNFVSTVRGLLTAPTTGSYTFWVAGNDNAQFYLSTTASPTNATLIAEAPGWTSYQQWNKFGSQKSASVNLTAGQQYYFELRYVETTNNDYAHVGWSRPGQSTAAPSEIVPGTALSPYTGNQVISGGTTGGGGSGGGGTGGGGTTTPPPATGSVVQQIFSGRTSFTGLDLDTTPTSTRTLNRLETASGIGDNFVSIVRGYITAPTTGRYTFFVAGNDNAQFYISNGTSVSGAMLIAEAPGWTNYQQWNKFIQQRSPEVTLTAGQSYYFELRYTETTNNDYAHVGWSRPGQSTTLPSEIIPGSVLSPFTGGTAPGGSTGGGGTGGGTTTPPPVTGSVTQQIWFGRTSFAGLDLNSTPDATRTLNRLETPSAIGDNFVSIVRGYLTAPTTADYTFFVAGNDNAQFYISNGTAVGNALLIAEAPGWTNYQQWDKFIQQRSPLVTLNAGQSYYFELRYTETGNNDYAHVGWNTNGGNAPTQIVPGSVLTPFV